MKMLQYAAALACVMAAVVAESPVPQDLSSQYGVPRHHTGPSPQYGTPSSGYGGDQDSVAANYEFKYDVEDQESGLKFGHMESREDDVAQGEYYVLLPDGRVQHVQYVADQDGYRPKISYEETQGYGRGPSQGYPRGTPTSNGYSN